MTAEDLVEVAPKEGSESIHVWNLLIHYALPALGLNWLLLDLSESSEWMPLEWRTWIYTLSMGAGSTCFAFAYRHSRRLQVEPKPTSEVEDRMGKVNLRANKMASEHTRTQRIRGLTRIWFFALVLFLGAQLITQRQFVHPWKPHPNVIASIFFHQLGRPSPEPGDFPSSLHDGPCYLETKGTGTGQYMEGSFLFPATFSVEKDADKLLQSVEATVGPRLTGSGRQFLVDYAPLDLKELITSSHGWSLGLTQFLFILLHIGMMICASSAYGLTFGWKGMASSQVPKLFSRFDT